MTPFDGRILLWHWQGAAVAEATIADLARAVTSQVPNAGGIAVKSSNGRDWQGRLDSKASMAVTDAGMIARWVDELRRYELETHLWCVVHGRDLAAEAERIVEACGVAGVRSMVLDVEAGEGYFGSQPPTRARALIERVRESVSTHLGLCFFMDDIEAIHFKAWLPHVGSLHPMLYHWDLSRGNDEPEPHIDACFERLAPHGLPIVPVLQTYPDPATGRPVPEAHIYRAGRHALARGAAGISYFRLGAADGSALAAIGRIDPRK